MVIEGPLAPWAAEMVDRLADLGYSPNGNKNHLALVARLSRFLDQRGLSTNDLTPVVLEQFCSSVRGAERSKPTPKAFVWLIGLLRDVGMDRSRFRSRHGHRPTCSSRDTASSCSRSAASIRAR